LHRSPLRDRYFDKRGVSIDLKRKKLTIGYREADIVFKIPQNPTGMHITVRPTMHEILHQRRLDYAAFSSQFRAKSSTLHVEAPPQLAKSPLSTSMSSLQANFLPETTPPNRETSVTPHLTVADLYTRFHHDTKTSRSSIPIWKTPSRLALMALGLT